MLVRLAGTSKKLESRDDRDWKEDIKIACKSANGYKEAFLHSKYCEYNCYSGSTL